MSQLQKYIKPYYLAIACAVFIKLCGAVMELFIPDLMETMLDVKVAESDVSGIYLYGILMVLAAVFCLLFNIIANRMSARSSGKITKAIRHDLFERLETLSSAQMDLLTVSSAESRLTSDTYNINQMLARLQRVGIRAPILLLGGTFMMLKMEPVLAMILIALLPIIGIVVYFVTKTSIPLYTKQQFVLDKVVRVVQENITGIRVIKALSKSEYEKTRFNSVNDELTRIDQKAGTVTAITNPVSSLTLNIGLTLVVLIGAFRVNSGACKSGVIVAFLQYFVMILNGMMGVTRIFILWSKGEASAKRVADVLRTPDDLNLIPKSESNEHAPHIEFKNVSFSYTGIGTNITDLSFTLEKGQTLGIIGSTGSGKSTIVNLLLRLYDPDKGQILIDGIDIRSIPNSELRQKFGVVFQNDFLTAGTIRDNIRFFRDISDESITEASHDAQAGFIFEKDGEMDAAVQVRGNNLSGGQKQRLLIARALAANPEILVLDDSSSALDYHTDSLLRKALRQNHRSSTTVLVAQRISSILHADLILVLSDSNVIGAGTHQELLQTCEEYRIIFDTQMGDRKEDA